MTTASPSLAVSPQARPWRVLLVDSDRQHRAGAAASLARRGCTVTEARSVGAAHLALERGRYDAVVTELKLSDGDGFAVFQAVRRTGCNVPVLVVAGVSTATGAPTARTMWFTRSAVTEAALYEALQGACHETARRPTRRDPHATVPAFRAALGF